MLVLILSALAGADPKVPYPHPLITEVLYAVPTGDGGDANKDGKRGVAGDEFIELANPHDKPIQLKGYMLTDRNPAGKGQLRFVFPALELAPGQVVVVFNGHQQSWKGPVGDSSKAPAAVNPNYGGAFVFTARSSSSKTSFANKGDFVLLTSPANEPVHCVKWGEFEEKIPEKTVLTEDAPVVMACSIERSDAAASMEGQPDADRVPFTPGVWPPSEATAGADEGKR